MNVLVIDDEPVIVTIVTSYLEAEGFHVYSAFDGESGLQLFREVRPEFVILDIMLPGIGGIELLQIIRRESRSYIIMLTAKRTETDRILGLSIGADDYLTKPFSSRELVARIKALLRREQLLISPDQQSLSFQNVSIDLSRHEVCVNQRVVELTPIEFTILVTLARHAGFVLQRAQIITHVWGPDFYGDERTVDVNVRRLRRKIEQDIDNPEIIITVRGFGYKFADKRV